MVASVDACAAALVREYLSRKGYKQALAALDGERGLTERDLTSRADIVERLQLQPLVKQNRSQLDPVSTLLELIDAPYAFAPSVDSPASPSAPSCCK